MAKFKYSAVTPDGVAVNGVEEADTRTQARIALARRDLEVKAIEEKQSLLSFEITAKKVPRKDLMHFSRQLAVFIRAGIPIIDGLEVIHEECGNKVFKRTIGEMIEALRSGATFADAAETHPYAFPPFYLGILRSAELTGNLDNVLDQLAEYIDRDLEARQRVTSALVYPGVVLVMSIATVVVLATFVMPRFKNFFDSLNAKLPLPTRILLGVSGFLSDFWYAIVGAIALVALLLVLALRTERGKLTKDRMILGAPVLGDLMQHVLLERFCRILSSMVRAGVPLPDALSTTSEATTNRVYRAGLADARESMVRGEGLAAPLAATGLFPAAARQMFKVGEDTGTLDQQLETAASYFDREVDYKIKRFTNLFEPAVIIMMGVLVGFVAVALVTAMYGIYNQVEV